MPEPRTTFIVQRIGYFRKHLRSETVTIHDCSVEPSQCVLHFHHSWAVYSVLDGNQSLIEEYPSHDKAVDLMHRLEDMLEAELEAQS